MYRLGRDEILYQIGTQSSNPQRTAISIFDHNCFERHVKCCAWLWDNFHEFDPRQLIRFNADTLCHAVTLIFDPLTFKVRGTSSVT